MFDDSRLVFVGYETYSLEHSEQPQGHFVANAIINIYRKI